LFFLTFASVMDTLMPAIMLFPMTRALIVREYRNGTYSTTSAFVSQWLALAMISISGCVVLAVPPYFIVGLGMTARQFFLFFLTLSMLTMIGCSMGVMYGSRCLVPDDAIKLVMPTIMPTMLFSGFMVPFNRIPVYFKWIYYASFFQYGLGLLLINEFEDVVFSDCDAPSDVTLSSSACNLTVLNATCPAAATELTASRSNQFCYTTGIDYLARAHDLVPADKWRNLGILGGYVLASIILAFASFAQKTRSLARQV